MKRFRVPITATLVLTACSAPRLDQEVPTVEIAYAEKYDAVCSLFGPPIKDEWRNELNGLIPAFQAEWESFGRLVISKVKQLSGGGFRHEPISIGLTLCDSPSEDSWSGIHVNMRYALRSFTAEPVSLRYKVATLVHELLHELVRDHPLGESKLLAEHQAESGRVLRHLHLLALLKATLLEAGQREALEEVIRIDSQLPGGYYRRAWELVNATQDGYLDYVREFRERRLQ